MKKKEKLAELFVREFAMQLPGSFDFGEGVKCYLEGFARAKVMSLYEAVKIHDDHPIAQNIARRINDIGEEEV